MLAFKHERSLNYIQARIGLYRIISSAVVRMSVFANITFENVKNLRNSIGNSESLV